MDRIVLTPHFLTSKILKMLDMDYTIIIDRDSTHISLIYTACRCRRCTALVKLSKIVTGVGYYTETYIIFTRGRTTSLAVERALPRKHIEELRQITKFIDNHLHETLRDMEEIEKIGRRVYRRRIRILEMWEICKICRIASFYLRERDPQYD